jgi:hypothetical protein
MNIKRSALLALVASVAQQAARVYRVGAFDSAPGHH